MNDEEFKTSIEELLQKIEHLPKDEQIRMLPMVQETLERHAVICNNSKAADKALSQWEDSINTLRIAFQYIMFDLESTRRERDEFRSMLE